MWFHWLYDWNGIKTSRIDRMSRKSGWLNYLMGKTRKRSLRSVQPTIPEYDFKAAGSVFTNGTHILAAQQPLKKSPMISGIGGSREDGETVMITAIRETLEELFDIKNVSKRLIDSIIESVPPKRVIKNGSYVFGIYDFNNLTRMLEIVKRFGVKSPLYKKFPETLSDLIFTRIISSSAELSHLALLPLVPNLKIDKNLLEDIPQIIGAV